MMKITRLYLIVLFVLLVGNVSAYCYEDIYGDWESLNGISIKIKDPNLKIDSGYGIIINSKNKKLIGSSYPEYNGVKLSIPIRGDSKTAETNYFTCRVVEINRQLMVVEPTNFLAKEIIKGERICLFNNNFIPVDKIEIDSFYYSRNSLQYELFVNSNGNVRLVTYGENFFGRTKTKIFEGKIKGDTFAELERLLINSRIFLLPACEWRSSCSCCFPVNLGIYFNGYFKRYQGVDNTVIYEIDNWSKSVKDSGKWQRVNSIQN